MALSKKFTLLVSSVILIHFLFVYATQPVETPVTDVVEITTTDNTTAANTTTPNSSVNNDQASDKLSIYDNLQLASLGLSKEAFEFGIKGFENLLAAGKLHNDQIISIVDFSRASSKKRLFVIDLKNSKVLFNTYVSHGRNSGREVAQEFSNQPESFKSSLGFYVTGGTYEGKHGFSMRLMGEEPGFNDNALSRAIVMHSAEYINESIIKHQGFIGRSLGCPALSPTIYKPIIETIRNGTCLFLYSPNKSYLTHSKLININKA